MYGLSYALRGIPTDDLEKHWYDVSELATTISPDNYSTLVDQRTVATIEHVSCVELDSRLKIYFNQICMNIHSMHMDRIQ